MEPPSLAPRELDVLGGMIRGDSVRAIAADLGIHPSTVKVYKRLLYVKLGAHTALEALAKAREFGFYVWGDR